VSISHARLRDHVTEKGQKVRAFWLMVNQHFLSLIPRTLWGDGVALWGDEPGTMGRRGWHFGETRVALWGDASSKNFPISAEKLYVWRAIAFA